MIKNLMASRLLSNDLNFREQIASRIRHVMEEVDMAIYGRSSGFGFVYSNLGDLIKKVQNSNASSRDIVLAHEHRKIERRASEDSMEKLKSNVVRLQEMQSRLEFMLTELEGLVKKG